ncbi:secretion protein HlyD family protein [Pseudopedobacter saltans DSM 12145]|uniref:Secretion protein HlyD family protein n=1 Tax=Pseudopedobacter saltans (strain ATCC 51119 / DSM 12145 / JCM 21818 / CCUG 39354 / LMG 10337 / NBRC 100064 / NCIMB 13643) TaxID=762903 RepID=F0SEC8_PSESL|nr:biotin/lipoyl-binding protein [Pseudopedobacter saltans]ADY50793.1 secretion protein HlyD family protein [Pseudopedobacter saltans DSM 12145]
MYTLRQVFLLFVSIAVFASCTQKPERTIEGKIRKSTISFAPKVTGRVAEIYVKEGDLVKKGDTLARLDVPEVDAKLSQVKGAVKASGAQRDMANHGATANQLKQLRAKQSGLQEQYNFAKKSFDRARAMFADSMMTPQAFDEITAKYQGAKAQLDAVNAEMNEALHGVRTETKTAAQGQADQALGALQEVEIAVSEKYIIATNDMEIETISLSVGELAAAGFPLFNGYQPHSAYFRITIPENEIGNYRKGQKLKVYVPYAKKSMEGTVQTIKQLTRYADITAAYPNYEIEEAIYELKIIPDNMKDADNLLANATVTLEK